MDAAIFLRKYVITCSVVYPLINGYTTEHVIKINGYTTEHVITYLRIIIIIIFTHSFIKLWVKMIIIIMLIREHS